MYCVYEHVFPNNKRYIGITSQDVNRRWQNGHGYDTQYFMSKAISKYGWENIKHNILENNLTKDEAKQKERFYIDKFNTNNLDYGYNRTIGGDAHICKPVVFNGKIYDSLEEFCSIMNLSLRTVGSWLTEQVPMDPYYYDKGLRYVHQNVSIIRGKSFKRKVICDDIEYDSIRAFCRKNNLNAGSVTHWLNGDKGMPAKWFDLGLRFANQEENKRYKAVK